MMRSLKSVCGILLCTGALLTLQGASAQTDATATEAPDTATKTRDAILNHRYPRLVVVISIDQLCQEYLTRFSDLFLPAFGADGNVGGFRLLMERGAFFVDAHQNHLPTFTGPGHATIMTGASPSETGIVSNDWITSTGQSVNCVGDDTVDVVGNVETTPTTPNKKSKSRGPASPKNLLAETVGDVLRLSNNRQSKVVGVARKDRAAILPTGKNPTMAVWYEAETGNWVTSTYYTTGTLPSFAERANRERWADRYIGKTWDYLLPKEQYRRSAPEGVKGVGEAAGIGATFPKTIGKPDMPPDRNYWAQVDMSPFATEMVFDLARAAIQDEALGEDDHPDILTIGLTTNDLIGHSFGPHSPEVQDLTCRTDRVLSTFFNDLRTSRSGGLSDVLFVLTGDHGVVPLPEWSAGAMKHDSGRLMYEDIIKTADSAIRSKYPAVGSGAIFGFSEPYIRFNASKLAPFNINSVELQETVAAELRKLKGIKTVYTRHQIENGMLPPGLVSDMIYNGFHYERSGDVFVLSDPFWYASRSAKGATHGSSYTYDTNVPLLIAGPSVRPGMYTRRVDMRDLAPTLSLMLGVRAPASSRGRILSEILE